MERPRVRRASRFVGVLLIVSLAVGVATVGAVSVATAAENATVASDADEFAVRQGGDCTVVQPLGNGSESVVDFYDYRVLPNYSSNGTTDIQIGQVSQVFVYNGSHGYSLVFLHDAVGNEHGGTITANITDLPADSEWVVEDDDYYNRDDVFNHSETESYIEWVWGGNRSDGGAVRGLSGDVRVRVQGSFNDESVRYPFEEWTTPNESNWMSDWVFRDASGNLRNLSMTDPITVEPGTCDDQSPGAALSATPSTVENGSTVTLDASDSTDNGAIVEYRWDVDGDGEIDETTAEPTLDHTYNSTGTYTPTVTTVDEGWNTDTASTEVTVTEPSEGCYVVEEAGRYTLDSDVSADPDGSACIEIRADDVTLDGQGHRLSGPGTGTAVLVTNASNVTVTDLTVAGWSTGVDVRNTTGATVAGTDATDVDVAYRFAGQSTDVTVEDSTAAASQWGYAFDPGAFDGDAGHAVRNLTLGSTSVWFTTDSGVSLAESTSPPALPSDKDGVGSYVLLDAPSNDTALDLTVGYGDAANVDESALELWRYAWTDDRSAGEWVNVPEPNEADTGANSVTATVSTVPASGGAVVTPMEDAPPVARASAPSSANVSETITFDGRNSTDDVAVAEYRWDLGDGTTATGSNVTHAYEESGTYTATLTVADDEGRTNTTTVEVTVPGSGIDVQLAASPEEAAINESVTLTAEGTTDDVETYRWDVDGDGEVDRETTDSQVSTQYATTGDYTASVTAVGANDSDTAETLVQVVDRTDPTARMTAPDEATAGESVAFDGSDSSDNVEVVAYEWDFGDGTTATGPTPSHTYDEGGTYTVSLTVRDEYDNTDTATKQVTVSSPDPGLSASLTADPSTAGIGESVTLDASDSTGEIETYRWDVDGDGEIDRETTGPTTTVSFDAPGEYTPTVTVAGNGSTDTDSTTVSVVDRTDPTASLSAPSGATTGESVEVDGSDSSDNVGIAAYQWDFGDGSTASGPTATHAYDEAGTYTVKLVVEDDAGNSDVVTQQITVEKADDGGGGGQGGNDRGSGSASGSSGGSTGGSSGGSTGGGSGGSYISSDEGTSNDDSDTDTDDGETQDEPSTPTVEVSTSDAGETQVQIRNATANERIDVPLSSDADGDRVRRAAVRIPTDGSVAFTVRTGLDTAAKPSPDQFAILAAVEVDTGSVEELELDLASAELERADLDQGDVAIYRYHEGDLTAISTAVDDDGENVTVRATLPRAGTYVVGGPLPDVAITDVSVRADSPVVGETVTVVATAENTGRAPGSAEFPVVVDGSEISTWPVSLDAGTANEVELPQTFETPGEHSIRIGGAETTVTVAEPTADLAVSDFSANRTAVRAGDAVAFTATVTNDGDASGSTEVTLEADPASVASKRVTVPPGESRTVTFVQAFETAGSHAVAAGDGTVTVEVSPPETTETPTAETTTGTPEAATETPESTTDAAPTADTAPSEQESSGAPVLGFGLSAALVGLLLVIGWFRRRG